MWKEMIEMGYFFRPADGLAYEIQQAEQEGKELQGLKQEMEKILQMEDVDLQKMKAADNFYDQIAALPLRKDFPYHEPSDLPSIQAARPAQGQKRLPALPAGEALFDKIYGAWLGRCAGCLLGKPVEMWRRARINGFAKDTGNYPIKNYFSSDVSSEIRQKYGVSDQGFIVYGSDVVAWINNVHEMPPDDDTNYTILGLKMLERYGFDFSNFETAIAWIDNLPGMHAMTAERVAYRNILTGIFPPDSGWRRNPYREWIGAQIRADIYGYVAAGNPELAAEFAWRDASVSHAKNGIYGEMFVAAMLAAAAVLDDVQEIIRMGLSQIPKDSRLSAKIQEVLQWKAEGIDWEQALDRLHEQYDEANIFDWCHVIPNAMVVCLALLFGENDFQRSVAIAIHAGFDTDCNGATVGSILGVILGAKALPPKWITPLNDKVLSTVSGFAESKISDLARRTVQLIQK